MKTMKTTIGFLSVLLFAGAVFTSCDKPLEQGGTEQQPGEIPIVLEQLEELMPSSTRATPIVGTTLPASSTFKLYAYRIAGTSSAVGTAASAKAGYVNATATAATSTEVSFGTYYWPLNTYDRLWFYSYYPDNMTGVTFGADGDPKMQLASYTVPTAWGSQKDFLYAYSAPATYGEAVGIVFKHAMSRITFQAVVTNRNGATGDVKISKIELVNALNKGTFTVGSSGSAAWTGKSTPLATYTTGTIGTANTIPDASPAATPTNWTYATTGTNESFLVLPMTKTELSTNATKIKVTASFGGVDLTPTEIALGSLAYGTHDGWEANKWVNYQLKINLSTSTISVSSVTVTNWGTAQNVALN